MTAPFPAEGPVLVSTLTPVLNEEAHIRETVAALQSQDAEGAMEFIFIDGRSTDATHALLEQLRQTDPRLVVLDNPARHTASALNIGLRAARGTYVARIDAHTWYPPHYLSKGIERLRPGDVDWVSGPQIPVGHDRFSTWVTLALGSRLATGGSNRWESDLDRANDEAELGTGVFTGVWRRDVLYRHRGWDEGWPINQDSEMAARFKRAGGRIVSLPALGARYTPRNTVRKLARQYFRYGQYRAKTSLRHPHAVRVVHLALPGIVVCALASLVGPKPLRRAARLLLLAYFGAVASDSVRVTRGRPRREAVVVALVLVVMHGAWGFGYHVGLVRFAAPATRRPRLAEGLDEPARDDV